MNKKIVTVLAALGLAAVAYGTLSTTSNAQAPASESMEQKVVRLEKEVSDLRKEVARLKQYANVITIPAANPQLGGIASPPGKPFGFNGQTYYYVPLSENPSGANTAVATPTLKVSPLSLLPK